MMLDERFDIIFPSLIKNIPNLLTMLNMLSGLAALYLTISKGIQHYRVTAYILILVAVVLDSFDGRLARMLDAETELGKQMDSFADIVSFGIAPIAVMLTLEPIRSVPAIFFVLMLYPLAGAFRLARFNLAEYSNYFKGLPITAAGFIQASFGLFLAKFTFSSGFVVNASVLLTATLSVMMVSNIRVPRLWPESDRD